MAAAAEAPSQAILGTGWYPACQALNETFALEKRSDFSAVQDENLRNVMMSWYYAGYYTGLYAGQNKDA